MSTTSAGKSEKQLIELKAMLDRGLITRDEHDAKRKQVLSTM